MMRSDHLSCVPALVNYCERIAFKFIFLQLAFADMYDYSKSIGPEDFVFMYTSHQEQGAPHGWKQANARHQTMTVKRDLRDAITNSLNIVA